MLMEAVVVVAAPASAQLAWLEKYDVPPDEIALGFDDGFCLTGQLAQEGRLGATVLSRLRMIDEIFSEMTKHTGTDRWTREALFTDAAWNRARQLAREVLTAVDERDAPLPDICLIR
ncbi:hypothetical protein ACWGCI_24290 [Streptomyces sp. NPDC054949]